MLKQAFKQTRNPSEIHKQYNDAAHIAVQWYFLLLGGSTNKACLYIFIYVFFSFPKILR